jgi:hypothetical protein
MPPRWMMQREMRFVTFSRAVPPMSLEGIVPSRIMKSWLRVGASSGSWIALSQPLWKAEMMKRSPSHHALAPAHRVRGITGTDGSIRPCEVDSLRPSMPRRATLTRDAAFCRNHSLAFRSRRRLLGSGGITTAAWCGPEHPGSRQPYAALLRRERMRVGDGPRGSPCSGASRCGRQRAWRRNAGDGASYGGPAGTCGDRASVTRFRCGSKCARPKGDTPLQPQSIVARMESRSCY